MVNLDKYENVYVEAINEYGQDVQKFVAVEEMSELIKEISKNTRGYNNLHNIAEEMADVYIMLKQLEYIYSIPEIVIQAEIRDKTKRLADRLEK